jgi:hypothetical protein
MANKATKALQPGDKIHFLRSGITFARGPLVTDGVISYRGQTITLTTEDLEASRDRFGNSWIERLLDDPATQIEKFGEVVMGRGPAPDGVEEWRPGSVEAEIAYQDRRARIYAASSDEDEIAVELAKLNNSVLGRSRPKKKSLAAYDFEDDQEY